MTLIKPFLMTQDLAQDAFLTLIRNYDAADNPLLMAFAPAQARFEAFKIDTQFLAATDQGRIFSPSGELKWRRMDDLMRTVYMGEQNLAPDLEDCSAKLKEAPQRQTTQLILWGVRTDLEQVWIEQQTPHRFAYPFTRGRYSRGRLAIEVENWCDSAGAPRFSRYCCLKEIKGEA